MQTSEIKIFFLKKKRLKRQCKIQNRNYHIFLFTSVNLISGFCKSYKLKVRTAFLYLRDFLLEDLITLSKNSYKRFKTLRETEITPTSRISSQYVEPFFGETPGYISDSITWACTVHIHQNELILQEQTTKKHISKPKIVKPTTFKRSIKQREI